VNARQNLESSPGAPDAAGRPYSFCVLNSRDADEQAQSVGRWDQSYDQISPGAFEGRVIDAWFGDVQLFRETTNQVVHQGGRPWPDSLAMAIPLSMDGEAFAHGRAMSLNTIFAVDARSHELDFVTPRALDVAAVTVNAEVMARFCRDVEGVEMADLMKGSFLLHCSPECMDKLRGFLNSLFDMLQSNHELLDHAQVRRSMQDAVLTNLFATLADSGNQACSGNAVNARRVVERAKKYLLSRPDEPVTIAQLCSAIGVSRRKLQYCFREALGYNPLHYLRAVRLNHVRRAIKNEASAHVSVQDVAARWGFWHLSHFAADYKYMFGELPSETLRRHRVPAS